MERTYVTTIIQTGPSNFGQSVHEEFHCFIVHSKPLDEDGLKSFLKFYGVSETDSSTHLKLPKGISVLSETKWENVTIHISTTKI